MSDETAKTEAPASPALAPAPAAVTPPSAALATSAQQSAPPRYDYKKTVYMRFVMLVAGLLACAVLMVIDLLTGSANLAVNEVFCALTQWCEASDMARVVVLTYRMPSSLMALGVGASLGVAGAIMQTILRNPLASPYTLGISAGAGFGAALTIVAGIGISAGMGRWLVPFNAFLFAILSSFLIYIIGAAKKLTPGAMILGGIGLSFMFGALQSMLQYAASAEQNQSIVFWLFGSLSRAETSTAVAMLMLVAAAFPVLVANAWKFTALQLGDEKATGLGINVKRLRILGFGMASLLTAVAVSFVGTIGFIGLAGPHIARMLVGEDQRFFMPLASIFGAAILLLASIVSKVIVPGFVFPIGIVTSLIGVPVFFSVLLSKKRSYFS